MSGPARTTQRLTPPPVAAPAARGRAFTLIELLVVILILGILVALVVGVSDYVMGEAARKQTQESQRILVNALQAYYDNSRPRAYPPDMSESETEWSMQDSSGQLVQYLTVGADPNNPTPNHPACRAATEKLKDLAQEAYDPPYFRDAYDNEMGYDTDGGIGGGPVIISAGPDGDPNTETDNIRSDGR